MPHELNFATTRKRRVVIVLADAVQNVLEPLILTDLIRLFFLKEIYIFHASRSACQLFIFLDKLWGDKFPYKISNLLHIQNVSK